MTKEITINPERPDSPDASRLVEELDAHLIPLYPIESHHGLPVDALLNDSITFFVVRVEGEAVGCGGYMRYPEGYGELKRMYICPTCRGLGLGMKLLTWIEVEALQDGYHIMRLETGHLQHEAIRMYQKAGYREIGPFGPYQPDPLSRFFEKNLLESAI